MAPFLVAYLKMATKPLNMSLVVAVSFKLLGV